MIQSSDAILWEKFIQLHVEQLHTFCNCLIGTPFHIFLDFGILDVRLEWAMVFVYLDKWSFFSCSAAIFACFGSVVAIGLQIGRYLGQGTAIPVSSCRKRVSW